MLITHQHLSEKEKRIITFLFYTLQPRVVVHLALQRVRAMLLDIKASKKHIQVDIGETKNPKNVEATLATLGRVKVYEVIDTNQAHIFLERIDETLESSGIKFKHKATSIKSKPLPQMLTPNVVRVKDFTRKQHESIS